MNLEDVIAACLRWPQVAARLRNILTSDLVSPSPTRRAICEFLASFMDEHGSLPKEGDWQAWIETVEDRIQDNVREELRYLMGRDLSEYTPEFVAQHAAERLKKAGAKTAIKQLQLMSDDQPAEQLGQLANEVKALEPAATADRAGPFAGEPSAPVTELYPVVRDRELDYDLEPWTAPGFSTLLSAPPKRGKSTFAALYAVAKARGDSFLGQDLDPGPALYVAPDESWLHVVRRFMNFGAPSDVHVWAPGRDPEVRRIAERAGAVGAKLIVLDTLLRVAGIDDENDNSAWARFFDAADPHIRGLDAAWLLVHHDRKAGGTDGQAIRGASVIFGSVDVAVSLQDDEDYPCRRVLRTEGTRLDEADDLVIELRPEEARYVAVGEAEVVRTLDNSALHNLRSVLTDEPAKVSTIRDRLADDGEAPSDPTVRRRLDKLVSVGLARVEGHGGQQDPKRYARAITPSQGDRGGVTAWSPPNAPEPPGEDRHSNDVTEADERDGSDPDRNRPADDDVSGGAL